MTAISSKPTYTYIPPTHSSADAHRAVKLAHYRLPDSHHELLEKSIEYKKSPWCARRAEPSPLPPSSSPLLSLSLSCLCSRSLFSSLSLSISLLPPFRPLLSLRLAASLARTRSIRVRPLFATKRGRVACIYWRSTEIGGMRGRTTAKDGDKDKRVGKRG